MSTQKVQWGRQAAGFGVVCLAGAVAVLVMLAPGAIDLARTAWTASVLVNVAVLVGAAFIYLHWRLSGSPLAGWLTLTLVVLSIPRLALTGVLIADPGIAERGPWWALVARVSVASMLFLVLVLAARLAALPVRPLPFDPLVAGVLTGMATSTAGLALVRWAPALVVPEAVVIGASLVLVMLAVGIGCLTTQQAQLPARARSEVVLGLVLLATGQGAQYATVFPSATRILTILASVAGGALLCHVALDMVRATVRNNRRDVTRLYERLHSVESNVRDSHARLHEVASTVAGITSVARIINEPTVALPRERRSLLERTLEEELNRLGRLTVGEPTTESVFALDDLVSRLVVAQQAQGRPVSWQPSALVVHGRPDDLAEALHVLLDNAAKHGRNAGTRVEARQRAGVVEIVVSDRGPGIPPEIQQRIFDWGVRGRSSRGQGIGLTSARRLLEEQGGYLELEESSPSGTTFVIGVLVGDGCDSVSDRAG